MDILQETESKTVHVWEDAFDLLIEGSVIEYVWWCVGIKGRTPNQTRQTSLLGLLQRQDSNHLANTEL